MDQRKDYTDYSTLDFITDDQFLQWVKYPDSASNVFWQNWIASHPHKKQQIDEAREFILQLQFEYSVSEAAAIDAGLERSLQLIAAKEQMQSGVIRGGRIRKVGWWMAAAILTGVIVFTGSRFLWPKPVMVQLAGFTDSVRRIKLPDNSIVILNARAILSYRKDWTQREVWLKGEAFFDITPAAAGAQVGKRFTVHSGNMNIAVLGTSFNVKEGPDYTNISLNTGKIKVHLNKLEETPFILVPGDFVQYSVKSNKVSRKKVNAELYAVWKEDGRQLRNVTLQEMATYIEDNYGYHVKIAGQQLGRQQISGGLRVKDEAALLETLSFALDLSVEKKADTLFIRSNINK